jgi:hypothetical protein
MRPRPGGNPAARGLPSAVESRKGMLVPWKSELCRFGQKLSAISLQPSAIRPTGRPGRQMEAMGSSLPVRG